MTTKSTRRVGNSPKNARAKAKARKAPAPRAISKVKKPRTQREPEVMIGFASIHRDDTSDDALATDDSKRPHVGVVVTLLDLGDGTSRVIVDDVRSDDPKRETSWKYDSFFTHKRLSSTDIDEMAL